MEPPVLRVTTRLVQLSVIVQDKKGNPVTGLSRKDFTLLEQGKEQQISTFAVESSRTLTRDSASLPPNIFSNRLETRFGVPTSVTVILLDGLNTAFEDQAYARQQIVKFLQQIQPQDRVAIYALGRETIRVLHDFTNNSVALVAVLQKHRGRFSPEERASNQPVESTGIADLDEFLMGASQRMVGLWSRIRAETTTKAMEALANHLARIPGRKNLIWVSASFPLTIDLMTIIVLDSPSRSHSFVAETEGAARALSNANVAIYPVDARGLMAPVPPASVSEIQGFRRRGPFRSAFGAFRDSIDTMQRLAEMTGGKAFYNRNDIDGAIRSAMDDSRVSYVLGYYPAHVKWDGHFVELKVKVNRPGVSVRARPGYFADQEGKLGEKEVATLLREAAASPLEATSLGMQVRADSADLSGKITLKLYADVDTRDVTLHREADRWVGTLDFYFAQRSADGNTISSTTQTLGMQLRDETYQLLLSKKTVGLTHELEIEENAVQVRVVVRDALSGSIGSVNISLSKLLPAASVSPRSSPPR